MIIQRYYDSYWRKRSKSGSDEPIPQNLPSFLKKYTSYGAILNNIEPCEKILDLGCGDGKVAALCQEKGEVFGVDVSSVALKMAKKRGIKTTRQDLNQLPLKFPDEFFDYVIATDVLEHVVDVLSLLGEVKRVLKKKGKLILTVPNFARLSNRLRMLFGDPVDILHWKKYGDELEHLHWFTLPKIEYLLLKETGFKNVHFAPTGLKNLSAIFGILRLFNLGSYLTAIVSK